MFFQVQTRIFVKLYSKVSNRRGMRNSRGGWKKYQKLISGEVGIVRGDLNLKVLIAWGGGRGWLLNCVFLSFSNHKNYSITDICVHRKSKIKTKVRSKQNLAHFKITNWRLFIHKFCNCSRMLLSSSCAIFIRALVFSSSPRANFSSFKYLRFSFLLIFDSFLFIIQE